MLLKSFLGALLGLSLPGALSAAKEEPTPAPYAPAFLTAQASHPTPQASPTAQPNPTAIAATPAPTAAPAPVASSPTADASGDSVVAEEVGEDGKLAAKVERPDLAKLDSETLASLAGGVTDS